LDRIAVVFLTCEHKFADEGSRTIPQFLALASWCDDRLAQWEKSATGEGGGGMNPRPDALRDAHKELRKAVPMQRREAANRDGDLHALGKETFRIWDQMRVNQESFDDRCAFLVGVLRQILCFGREWKYLCERCDDYGLVLATCDGSSACGRPRQHLPHTYGTPCGL
jgi:hypothetical protein